MDYYVPNRACYCTRCRWRGYMGPIIMITLGALFLLSEFTNYRFRHTWPVLLITIGIVKVLGSSAATTNHVPPYAPGLAAAPPPQPPVPPTQNSEPPQGVSHV